MYNDQYKSLANNLINYKIGKLPLTGDKSGFMYSTYDWEKNTILWFNKIVKYSRDPFLDYSDVKFDFENFNTDPYSKTDYEHKEGWSNVVNE